MASTLKGMESVPYFNNTVATLTLLITNTVVRLTLLITNTVVTFTLLITNNTVVTLTLLIITLLLHLLAPNYHYFIFSQCHGKHCIGIDLCCYKYSFILHHQLVSHKITCTALRFLHKCSSLL